MVLVNEQYKVTITTEYRPSLEGHFVLYQTKGLDFDDFYTARFITVEPAAGPAFRVAVLDFIAASTEPGAVLEGDMLTMILFRTILRIELSTRTVVQSVECENVGGLEKIHPIDDGYLIKGECDIFQYDKALNRIWAFSARDVFARPGDEECFWIDGNDIHCRDWAGWHYVLSINGKVINEICENYSGN